MRKLPFLHRLSLQVQERAPIGTAYGAKKAMSDLTTCGQVRPLEKPLRHRAGPMGGFLHL